MNEEMIKKVLGLLDSRYGFEFSFKKKNWTLVTFNGQEYLIVHGNKACAGPVRYITFIAHFDEKTNVVMGQELWGYWQELFEVEEVKEVKELSIDDINEMIIKIKSFAVNKTKPTVDKFERACKLFVDEMNKD